ncbi:unnamed protein product [Protopolystoma xenopodis]|uniref:Uncharacterized protein n=1 Tax=Protopolystoma xenopodis TaxID=117903 RepID=A0A3S5CFD9_9PLAT|nr:unnamed protein product [Protopolystoma xenopodis]
MHSCSDDVCHDGTDESLAQLHRGHSHAMPSMSFIRGFLLGLIDFCSAPAYLYRTHLDLLRLHERQRQRLIGRPTTKRLGGNPDDRAVSGASVSTGGGGCGHGVNAFVNGVDLDEDFDAFHGRMPSAVGAGLQKPIKRHRMPSQRELQAVRRANNLKLAAANAFTVASGLPGFPMTPPEARMHLGLSLSLSTKESGAESGSDSTSSTTTSIVPLSNGHPHIHPSSGTTSISYPTLSVTAPPLERRPEGEETSCRPFGHVWRRLICRLVGSGGTESAESIGLLQPLFQMWICSSALIVVCLLLFTSRRACQYSVL